VSRRLDPDGVLVIASHNAGKVRELHALFAPHVRALRSAAELDLPEPHEEGESFAAIAELKARAAARASGLVAVADDSGLVVPALGGAPGVRSARWAERDFAAAMERVQRELGDRDRSARMLCALALAWPDGPAETFEGSVEGELVWPPRGALGFGYEPMFAPAGSLRTYGEMARNEKHADDPRARAFALLSARCFR
jgi:XTP/dITP diphosphohydrolase